MLDGVSGGSRKATNTRAASAHRSRTSESPFVLKNNQARRPASAPALSNKKRPGSSSGKLQKRMEEGAVMQMPLGGPPRRSMTVTKEPGANTASTSKNVKHAEQSTDKSKQLILSGEEALEQIGGVTDDVQLFADATTEQVGGCDAVKEAVDLDGAHFPEHLARPSSAPAQRPDRSQWHLPPRLEGSVAKRARSAMGIRADTSCALSQISSAHHEALTLKVVSKRRTQLIEMDAPRRDRRSQLAPPSAFGEHNSKKKDGWAQLKQRSLAELANAKDPKVAGNGWAKLKNHSHTELLDAKQRALADLSGL